jgi:hypothetical protein
MKRWIVACVVAASAVTGVATAAGADTPVVQGVCGVDLQ